MAEVHTDSLKQLIEELCRLPGVGARSAERIALYLLDAPSEKALHLAQAIRKLKTSIRNCDVCFNLTESELCSICSDDARDRSVICVVELPKDVMRIESTGAYKGLYHVLGGHIAPLDGIGPDKLNIDSLLKRARQPGVKEIILSMNPTVEGDGTALHIGSLLQSSGIKITRLARGLASGASLEFTNKDTITEAITGRQPLP
ncbi:MAG: recombination protein RecR [Actinobacteria bacterium]|nr:recombination protein RecR [Actinomycetota bacterium]